MNNKTVDSIWQSAVGSRSWLSTQLAVLDGKHIVSFFLHWAPLLQYLSKQWRPRGKVAGLLAVAGVNCP